MQSRATTVKEYLASLPPERRAAIEAVRDVIRTNVDGDIEEGMQYGMIGFYVPHRVFPAGYHTDASQPLPYVCLASQKQHMAVYLMYAYTGTAHEQWLREAYRQRGKRLDLGKSCLRFRSLEAIDLEVLAESLRRAPTRAFIAQYEASRPARKPAEKKVAKKTAKRVAKKTAQKTAKKTAPARKR